MNIMKVGLLFFYIIWIVFGTPFSNNIKLLIFSVGNSRTDCWKLFKFPRTTYSCASLQSVVMKLLTLSCFLLGAKFTESQFGQPTNANPFVDQVKINHFFLWSWTQKILLQMLEEVIMASNETLFLDDEQFILVVDLFIFRPELQLQVTGDWLSFIIIN